MVTASRIDFAIKRRRLTKSALAESLGVAERTVRRWIDGASPPSEEHISEIASILGFPIDFFSGPELERLDYTQPTFRARRSSRRLLNAATQSAALAFEIERALVETFGFRLPPVDLPELPQAYAGKPEDAASWVRAEWGLGERPIRNVLALLEKYGIRLFSLPPDLVDGKVSAFSIENEKGTPFVLLNTRDAFSGERTRFDAAHELGHLVMHRRHAVCQSEDIESEADRFAAAFLIPAESLRQASRGVFPTLASLSKLKLRWGVSVAALARRMRDLKICTPQQYKRICIELSRYGRKREPNPIRGEHSRLLQKVVASLRSTGELSSLSAMVTIHPEELNEYLFGLTMTLVEGDRATLRGGNPPKLKLLSCDP